MNCPNCDTPLTPAEIRRRQRQGADGQAPGKGRRIMQTVYKYAFSLNDRVYIGMPQGAQILHVEEQRGMPCLWALVDSSKPTEERCFEIRGTGHPVEPDLSHVGSFLMRGGTFVWHVFERKGYFNDLKRVPK